MRGGGDQDDIHIPASGVEGTYLDFEYLKRIWDNYCHKHNDDEEGCKAASDFCSYSLHRGETKCANNYGDLETAEERMVQEKARQKEIARLKKLIIELEGELGGETTTSSSTTGYMAAEIAAIREEVEALRAELSGARTTGLVGKKSVSD